MQHRDAGKLVKHATSLRSLMSHAGLLCIRPLKEPQDINLRARPEGVVGLLLPKDLPDLRRRPGLLTSFALFSGLFPTVQFHLRNRKGFGLWGLGFGGLVCAFLFQLLVTAGKIYSAAKHSDSGIAGCWI